MRASAVLSVGEAPAGLISRGVAVGEEFHNDAQTHAPVPVGVSTW